MATSPEEDHALKDAPHDPNSKGNDPDDECAERVMDLDAMGQWEEKTTSYPNMDYIQKFHERNQRINGFLTVLYPDGLGRSDYIHVIGLVRIFNQLISQGNES